MATTSEKVVFQLIEDLYEVAGGAVPGWDDVNRRIATLLSSGPSSVAIFVASADEFCIAASTLDPVCLKAYEEHYRHVSPFRPLIAKLAPGNALRRSECVADGEFERSEIYNGFYQPQDIYEFEHHALSAIPGLTGSITLSRPRSRPYFDIRQKDRLTLLLPHLRRAMALQLFLGRAERDLESLDQILASSSRGVITIDSAGKVVFLNGPAEKIVKAKDGLALDRGGVLYANRSEDSSRLRSMIESVFSPKITDHTLGGVLQVCRQTGKRPLQLVISPLADHSRLSGFGDSLAVCFIHDPERIAENTEAALISLYALTKTEARIAELLVRGNSLSEIGDEMEISLNTVRCHLKHIFSKTDTSRQSELMRLILNGPAQLEGTHHKDGDGDGGR